MPDYISVHTGAVIDNAVTTVINGKAGIQGIISNGTEIEPNQNNKVSINIPDISQSTGDSTTSTMSQNAITNHLREKANADLLNNYYQKNESYSKTEIDNMIAAIPKFDIKVVLTLPTENISESTIYLVPTQQEEGGLYQEYVYINNRWELIGGQSVDLSNYYTKQAIDNLLNDKLDTGEVVQTTGYNTDKVMSQKAVTDIVNDKFDKSSINNYYNKSETDNLLNDRININKIAQDVNGSNADYVVSQRAIKNSLDGKIDKSAIKQEPGDGYNDLMSQHAIKALLDGKIDKSWCSSGTFSPVFGWVNPKGTFGTNYDDAGVTNTDYDFRTGKYIRFGDLCYVCISMKGNVHSPQHKICVGSLPFDADSSWNSQSLPIGVFVKVKNDGTQDWTPTAGIVGRIISGKDFAIITQDNGYIETPWPDGENNVYYFQASGVYKIKTN